MSDHEPAPDPADRAYAEAEAALRDDEARAARRARVLAAVAGGRKEPSAEPAPVERRRSWGRGGWLVAAGVAGLGALVAIQANGPAVVGPAPTTQGSTSPPVVAPAPAPAQDRAAPAEPPAVQASGPAPGLEASIEGPSAPPAATAAPPAPPQPPPALEIPPPLAAAQAAAAPPAEAAADVVVTGRSAGAPVAAPPPVQPRVAVSAEAASALQGARLRAAAAAGRLAEIETLLGQGADVDAPDEFGETALMKAVKADRPAAVALLRRRGASLELKNRAGESARDMAAAAGDGDLERALGARP